jgi:hypothetical protein
MTSTMAVRTSDFINTLGVSTHINFTDGQYQNINTDLAALAYLGIANVRDAAPNPAFDITGQRHLANAADAGIKFTFFAQGSNPLAVVARLHDFVAAHPGSVAAIEGPNEVNNWPVSYAGLSGSSAAQAYQQTLFDALNSDALLKDIPVLGFTDYPVHASASDWNNIHPYPKNGNEPRDTIASNAAQQSAVDPGKPFAITEGGYHTALGADTHGGWEGVDEATQAKLSLNFFMDAAQLGSRLTYQYQLLDGYADPTGGNDQETHFGFFRLDGSAKPAATALHNLTTLLHDDGANAASFAAGALDYTAVGMPASAHSYLMSKSDGSFQIVAWNEPDIWDQAADRPISAEVRSVTFDLGSTFGKVDVYDPLQGTSAIASYSGVSSVRIGLTDHPLVIQLSGPAAAVDAPAAPSAPTQDVPVSQIPAPPDPVLPDPVPAPAPAAHQSITSIKTVDLGAAANALFDGAILSGRGNVSALGNDLDNALTGNSGSNTLDGKGGADLMKGLGGNDTYVVDNAGDVVDETGAGGRDTIRSTLSIDLTDTAHVKGSVENALLLGSAALDLIGNALSNQLTGNAGDNHIAGCGGRDVLRGNGGHDTFAFSDKPAYANVATIADFSAADDTIELDHSVFAALALGVLGEGQLRIGNRAVGADDHLIYNPWTGSLSYDPDGAGGVGQSQFASLRPHLALTHDDFQIV